jgi:hypothetical protein
MKTKTKINAYVKGKVRERAVAAGAYDGRFAPKVIGNKKKHESKRFCKRPIKGIE